uniref:NAC domain-containing protein 86-like n=1 Tax=Fragaria vesca subsp. vesca TaxID=101020 RepID=UPI0005C9AF9D|nr:PREDICTED: NAC domain-containing protein 86-like [Fragaria vesca subsp. vesca]
MGLLPGQRFCPMDDELLFPYLKPMVNGQMVPGKDSLFCDSDLYRNLEPWQIWQEFESRHVNDLRKNKDMYFFIQNKKLGSRTSRKVGTGSWKGQGAGKEVYLLDDNAQPPTILLGLKKTYTYVNRNSVHHGHWVMYEFQLHSSQITQLTNDCVPCMLRNNDELSKRKRHQEEEGLEEPSVEASAGDSHLSSDAFVVEEEPQEKRQRLQAPGVTAPFFNGADLEQWYLNQQVMQPIPPLIEAEQEAGPTPLEDEPAVALQGSENLAVQQPATELQQREPSQITTEPQQREEN